VIGREAARSLIIVLGALLVAACSSETVEETHRIPTRAATHVWTVQPPEPPAYTPQFAESPERRTPTVLIGDTIYAGFDGGLRAVAAGSGRLRWSFDLPAYSVLASYRAMPRAVVAVVEVHPSATPGVPASYVPASELVGLDPGTGSVLWRRFSRERIPPGSLAMTDRGVALAAREAHVPQAFNEYSEDMVLVAFDPGSGRTSWQAPLPPYDLPLRSITLTPVGDVVVAQFASSTAESRVGLAVHDGSVLWQGPHGVHTQLMAVDGERLLASQPGAMALVDATSGRTVRHLSPHDGTWLGSGHLLYSYSGDTVVADDLGADARIWTTTIDHMVGFVCSCTRGMRLDGGHIYLAGQGGHVYSLAARDGHVDWKIWPAASSDGSSREAPLVYEDLIVLRAHSLHAYRVEVGN